MNSLTITSFFVGAILGLGFATLQWLMLLRHEMLERQQQLRGIWRLVPGSAARVAVLLAALVLVQILFPQADLKWLAAGLLAAATVPMVWRLQRMLVRRKST